MASQQMEKDPDRFGVRNLRGCSFYWPGSQPKVFLGWAFSPQNSQNPKIDLWDKQ